MSPEVEELRQVLEASRAAGFLGPGPIEPHLNHAAAFGEAAEAALAGMPASFVDLGTGGGVPGLVLARRWPDARGVLVDSSVRRCAALREAVARLGFEGRVEVFEGRAESAAREDELRERFDVATARSFAEPAVTAEIAAGFVQVGGVLVVSEPPDPDPRRWPMEGLEGLGFGAAERVDLPHAHFVVIRKAVAASDEYPRKVGRPAKRPLW